MRRALAWGTAALLLAMAAAAIMGHLCPFSFETYAMPRPEAALRGEERMNLRWPGGSVDPNAATVAQLDAIPGVGPFIARRIVYERVTDGAYRYPEDLLAVSGIGEDKLRQIWDQLFFPW